MPCGSTCKSLCWDQRSCSCELEASLGDQSDEEGGDRLHKVYVSLAARVISTLETGGTVLCSVVTSRMPLRQTGRSACCTAEEEEVEEEEGKEEER